MPAPLELDILTSPSFPLVSPSFPVLALPPYCQVAVDFELDILMTGVKNIQASVGQVSTVREREKEKREKERKKRERQRERVCVCVSPESLPTTLLRPATSPFPSPSSLSQTTQDAEDLYFANEEQVTAFAAKDDVEEDLVERCVGKGGEGVGG
jgi:hypothetical protein